ncbi:ABC transporter substrate-binding protein [Muricoccus radiodurans]|uniref:ABC transporter substrate-binding protein n=1 Tax=Muricoccus radiodurans TaxID=2231721 RepID=UPI003CFB9F46
MISARARLSLLAGAALAPFCATAQEGRTHRIGLFTYAEQAELMALIKREFAARGFREGENTVFLERSGRRDAAATERFAAELVAWPADLIVAMMTTAAKAARHATEATRTPVVFWSAEPVESGIVDRFAQVGGNLTGVTVPVDGQLLQLRFLKEAIPDLSRVGFLYNPNYGPAPAQLRALQDAARLFHLEAVVYQTLALPEIEPAIARMRADGLRGFVVGPHELFNVNGARIGEWALRHRLAAVSFVSSIVRGGGVACYTPDFGRIWPAAVEMGARILRGTPVGSIPVDRKIQLRNLVNRRALAALGLQIPAGLMDEADEVIA